MAPHLIHPQLGLDSVGLSEQAREAGMRDGNVHRVRVVVRHVLPVDVAHAHRYPPKRLEFLQSIAGQFLLIRRQHFSDAWQARLQPDKYESLVDFELERLQRVVLGRKLDKFLAMRHGRERAVEIVGPGMVGADDSAGTMSGSAVEKPRGSMAADVEERLDAVVAPANGDYGFAEEFQRMVIARVRNVVQMTNDLPRCGEHPLFFSAQEIGVPIYPSGQTEVFLQRSAPCIHQGLPSPALVER